MAAAVSDPESPERLADANNPSAIAFWAGVAGATGSGVAGATGSGVAAGDACTTSIVAVLIEGFGGSATELIALGGSADEIALLFGVSDDGEVGTEESESDESSADSSIASWVDAAEDSDSSFLDGRPARNTRRLVDDEDAVSASAFSDEEPRVESDAEPLEEFDADEGSDDESVFSDEEPRDDDE